MGVEQFESEETKTPFSNVWTLERVNQFEGIQVPLHVIDAIAGASFNETLQKIKNRPIAQAVSDPDRIESLRIEGNLAEMHRMMNYRPKYNRSTGMPIKDLLARQIEFEQASKPRRRKKK